MFVLQANDSFEVAEYLKSWEYDETGCVGFSYTKFLVDAIQYTSLYGAWKDLQDHGFQLNFMIMEVEDDRED